MLVWLARILQALQRVPDELAGIKEQLRLLTEQTTRIANALQSQAAREPTAVAWHTADPEQEV